MVVTVAAKDREHSSGGRQRLGAMSKQGNTLLRYLWLNGDARGRAGSRVEALLSAQTGAERAIGTL